MAIRKILPWSIPPRWIPPDQIPPRWITTWPNSPPVNCPTVNSTNQGQIWLNLWSHKLFTFRVHVETWNRKIHSGAIYQGGIWPGGNSPGAIYRRGIWSRGIHRGVIDQGGIFLVPFFLTTFTRYCFGLCNKIFSLFWLNFRLMKVSNLNSEIFFLPLLLLLWTKVIFYEIKANK